MASTEEPKSGTASSEAPNPDETPATETQPSATAESKPTAQDAAADAPPPPPPKDGPTPPAKDEPKTQEPSKSAEDCGCGPEPTNAGPINNSFPSPADLEKISKLEVQDAEGKKYTFKSIVEAEGAEKHLVIFIRHFFCGYCQDYTRALSTQLPPASLPPATKLTIIGCGSPDLISTYNKNTSNTHPLYADQSQGLYKALGFVRTLDMGKKPDYVTSSLLGTTVKGILQGLGAGKNATKAGDWMQVGGEFLFAKDGKEGPMWPVTWAHRMKTTRDHAEIKELKSVLGVEVTSNGVNGTTQSETKPWRSSTFFGRKDKDAKQDKSESKGTEKTAEAAAST